MTLEQFRQARLPLGAAVQYAGLQCKIAGRTFGRLEQYDLETRLGDHRFNFPGLTRDQFIVDFGVLANGSDEKL